MEAKNVSNEILSVAAKTFIYLNFCPFPNDFDTFREWIEFYHNLFQKNNPKIILITLNRLLKTTQNEISLSLLQYVSTLWRLRLNIDNQGSYLKEKYIDGASQPR